MVLPNDLIQNDDKNWVNKRIIMLIEQYLYVKDLNFQYFYMKDVQDGLTNGGACVFYKPCDEPI